MSKAKSTSQDGGHRAPRVIRLPSPRHLFRPERALLLVVACSVPNATFTGDDDGSTIDGGGDDDDGSGELALVLTPSDDLDVTEGRTAGQFNGRAVNLVTTETMVLKRGPEGWRIQHIHWSSRTPR